jgi:hypothetical protein
MTCVISKARLNKRQGLLHYPFLYVFCDIFPMKGVWHWRIVSANNLGTINLAAF